MSERIIAPIEQAVYAGIGGANMSKGAIAGAEIAVKATTEGAVKSAAEVVPKTAVQALAEGSRAATQTADGSREFLGNLRTPKSIQTETGSGLGQNTSQIISTKEQRIGDLQGELNNARETVSRVREWPQPDFRYQVPYAEIQAESIESAITNEQLEVQILQKSDGTPSSKDAVIEDFIRSQQRQKATDQGTSLIQSAEARKSTLDADVARYQDLISKKGQELEEAAQQRAQLRGGSDADPDNVQLAQNYDRARFTQRDINIEVDNLNEGLQKAQERATVGASQIEDQIKKGQAILEDVTQNPEAYDKLPGNIEEDPDFESCLKAAKFSESEDTAKFKENIGLDPAAEAKKYFQVRFPEKYAYYQRKGLVSEPSDETSATATAGATEVSAPTLQAPPVEVAVTDVTAPEAPSTPNAGDIETPVAAESPAPTDETANVETPEVDELAAKAEVAFAIGIRDRYNPMTRAFARGDVPTVAEMTDYDPRLLDEDFTKLLAQDGGPRYILSEILKTAVDSSGKRIMTDEEVASQIQNEEWVGANSIKAAEKLIIAKAKKETVSKDEAKTIVESTWGADVVASLALVYKENAEVKAMLGGLLDKKGMTFFESFKKDFTKKSLLDLLLAILGAIGKVVVKGLTSGMEPQR
ncbi:MAG TPA: hypothetical protein VLE91_02440 [Candidatus Saccharimonadales bacterium]|nr:hypothetical protein [Candidatus Saccharimonadales bacterium]